MTDSTKNAILEDALFIAIDNEKKLIKYRKIICALSVACMSLVGVIIWIVS